MPVVGPKKECGGQGVDEGAHGELRAEIVRLRRGRPVSAFVTQQPVLDSFGTTGARDRPVHVVGSTQVNGSCAGGRVEEIGQDSHVQGEGAREAGRAQHWHGQIRGQLGPRMILPTPHMPQFRGESVRRLAVGRLPVVRLRLQRFERGHGSPIEQILSLEGVAAQIIPPAFSSPGKQDQLDAGMAAVPRQYGQQSGDLAGTCLGVVDYHQGGDRGCRKHRQAVDGGVGT
ncbi:hypothetical protein H4K36_35770 [Streptomyces sp. DHE7-1]|nr:hypothetical protein [Streptomyces sp. DHE7-1]